ncbi:MAG: HAD family hydrolase [Deltaproteobacteria bacterium]|nr:MAG: HAD family hydrolase [Deltaproteobacteria bacterium]
MNILFDLDGTLTDPKQGIIGCLRYALESLGANAPAAQALERLIGPPLSESFAHLLGPGDNDRVEQAVRLYRERFTAKGMFENSVYPGIVDALAELRDYGVQLFVATSKPRGFAERIVEHFELGRFFSNVYGSELSGANADKKDLLGHVLRAESLPPANTVMVGDRSYDILGARANSLFSVGVLWGYGSREELVAAGAGALCDAPNALGSLPSLVDRAVPC